MTGVREQLAERVDDLRDPVQLLLHRALQLDHGQWTGLGGGHDRPS
jgi:hypothetical protein